MNRHGIMVVSIDLELSWGRFDKMPLEELNGQSLQERPHIRRLLSLMDQYEIPATWAMVGHLMLDGCARDSAGVAHRDVTPHAAHSWFPRDWFSTDPCTEARLAPAWYAPDILEWIRSARVRHDIGSHSFAHVLYGDPGCTAAMAHADLKAAKQAAAGKQVVLESFVFPRNQAGHLDVLRAQGIRSFRGRSFRGAERPLYRWIKGTPVRMLGFLDQLLAFPPRQVRAEETLPGLWNIPGNHFFMPRNGLNRVVPMSSRVRKGTRGINRAIRTGGLYHLWFHPADLLTDSDAMFAGLEALFSYARRQQEQGCLEVLTMAEYSRRLEDTKLIAGAASQRPGG